MKVIHTLVLRSSVEDLSSMDSESGSWTTYSLSFNLLNKINSSPPEMEARFTFVSSLIVGLGSLWLAGFSSTRIVCLAWAYHTPTSWSQLLFYLLCSFLPEMSTASFWTRTRYKGCWWTRQARLRHNSLRVSTNDREVAALARQWTCSGLKSLKYNLPVIKFQTY